MLLKGETRAMEYRTKAQAAAGAAAIASLDRVRQRHEIAASVWNGLAETEEHRAQAARAAMSSVLCGRAGPNRR